MKQHVCGIAPGNVILLPAQARGHLQQLCQADVRAVIARPLGKQRPLRRRRQQPQRLHATQRDRHQGLAHRPAEQLRARAVPGGIALRHQLTPLQHQQGAGLQAFRIIRRQHGLSRRLLRREPAVTCWPLRRGCAAGRRLQCIQQRCIAMVHCAAQPRPVSRGCRRQAKQAHVYAVNAKIE